MNRDEFVTQRFTALGTPNPKHLKDYGNSASDEIHRMRANSAVSRTEIHYLNGVNISGTRARAESDIERVKGRFELDTVLVTKSSLQRSV
jgi:hypothetical protein